MMKPGKPVSYFSGIFQRHMFFQHQHRYHLSPKSKGMHSTEVYYGFFILSHQRLACFLGKTQPPLCPLSLAKSCFAPPWQLFHLNQLPVPNCDQTQEHRVLYGHCMINMSVAQHRYRHQATAQVTNVDCIIGFPWE